MLRTDVANLLLAKYGKKNPAEVKAGDTVRVHQKIKEGDKERVQIFEGLVIATKHGRGLNGTFTVRKIAVGGIGVERTYPLHSPNIVKVERVKTAAVKRAKLYYMRDRRGKNARFRNEVQNPMTWDETAALAAIAEAEAAEAAALEMATTQEVVAEVAAVAATQEDMLATVAEGEAVPAEAQNPEGQAEINAEAKSEEAAA